MIERPKGIEIESGILEIGKVQKNMIEAFACYFPNSSVFSTRFGNLRVFSHDNRAHVVAQCNIRHIAEIEVFHVISINPLSAPPLLKRVRFVRFYYKSF